MTTLRDPDRSEVFGPATHNGYEGEWRAIADIVCGRQRPTALATLIDDLRFALQLADDAAATGPCVRPDRGVGMTALPIFAAEDVRAGWATDSVLASLPLSFGRADQLQPSVAVVGGARRLGRGRRRPRSATAPPGCIVIAPVPADSTRACTGLESPMPRRHRFGLGVEPGDHGRGRCAFGRRPRAPGSSAGWSSARARPLAAVLLDQSSLVRAPAGPADGLRMLLRSDHGYSAAGRDCRRPGRPDRRSHQCASRAGADPTAHRRRQRRGPDPDRRHARPALLTVTGPDGTTLAPTLYESGHRASWRRLHRLLTDHESGHDVDDLDADIRTASA